MPRMESTPQEYRQWLGNTEQREDVLQAAQLAAMSALLDRDDPVPGPASSLPPLWHWMLFNTWAKQAELGPDGHPQRGDFLPPVALPRRMWAGGRLTLLAPIRPGQPLTRHSCVASIQAKQGRSGPLVFVNLQHEVRTPEATVLLEEQDLVYRAISPVTSPAPAAAAQARPLREQFSSRLLPDAVLLFRYSALTGNGHRIHYDRDYARAVESYPGLVVHGPLIATLLADLLRRERPNFNLRRFAFRALQPAFDQQTLHLHGRIDGAVAQLWACTQQGELLMQANAEA